MHALLDDRAVLVKCTLSPLCSGRGQQGVLFAQLVDLFRFYSGFPIADHTGEALGEEEVVAAHYERVRMAWANCLFVWMRLGCIFELYHEAAAFGVGSPGCGYFPTGPLTIQPAECESHLHPPRLLIPWIPLRRADPGAAEAILPSRA